MSAETSGQSMCRPALIVAVKIAPLAHTFPMVLLTTPSSSADRLAQLVEHRTTVREVVGSNPGRTNTQGL